MIKNSKAIYNRVMESIAPKVKKSILNELYRDGEDEWEEAEWYNNSPEGILDKHNDLDYQLIDEAKEFMNDVGGQLPVTVEIGPGISSDIYRNNKKFDVINYEIGDKAYYNDRDRICRALSDNFPINRRKLVEIPIDPNKDITTFSFNATISFHVLPKFYRKDWIIIDFKDIATKKVISTIYYCPPDRLRQEAIPPYYYYHAKYDRHPKLRSPSYVYSIVIKRENSWYFVPINVKMSMENQKKLYAQIEENIRIPDPLYRTHNYDEFNE